MIDPDLLAIQRRRLTARQCARCGAFTGRATLCSRCAESWRYCPRCERVYPRERCAKRAYPNASFYCRDCHRDIQRKRRGCVPLDVHQARVRTGCNPRLPAVIRLYRRGLTINAIAAALHIPHGTVGSIIMYARRTGRWPKNLTRGRGRRRAAVANGATR